MAKAGKGLARAPAGRIINLKPEVSTEEVQGLLALAVGRPTATRIEEVCQMYQFLAGWDLFGYRIGGDVVGCIGIQLLTWREGMVRHISVAPEHR
ncbi:MAG: hypothetical protein HY533_02410, partial [Chloroflexi bacterium]|nr:hypothetical protein [Chloroflexota bacterium]